MYLSTVTKYLYSILPTSVVIVVSACCQYELMCMSFSQQDAALQRRHSHPDDEGQEESGGDLQRERPGFLQEERLCSLHSGSSRRRCVSLCKIKGPLSCKMHFLQHVSPVCRGTHAASENQTLSLFLRSQISKNGGTTELIQICIRYDVISEMWAGFTPTALSETLLSETMRDVFWTYYGRCLR